MNKSKYKIARDRVKLSSGDVIRTARELLEMTQDELAKKAGMRQSHLSEIERGKRPVGKAVAMKLARILELPPAQILFAGQEPREGSTTQDDVEAIINVFLNRIMRKLRRVQSKRSTNHEEIIQQIIEDIESHRQQSTPSKS